ncbi:ferritin-like domain-containing protein [Spirillospora sp. NBC_01491]|uniref:ferritin-like domain-containing protein n=1 Tax=Spirillospora sp. NBC_01491 TaxID=2976007 RepID=UPI002E37FB99|nr:ferritin-like protein [Spirillospora sp. NBC_01491]
MTATTTTAVPAQTIRPLLPGKGITTVRELADHLHVAAQVELSTIPLFLYSAYSLKTQGHSQWAAQRGVLRTLIGVSIEEMLHLALVRNLMVAIGHGDEIKFYDPKFVPVFPSDMLNRNDPADPDGARIRLELKALSTAHVRTFRRVEQPDRIPPRAAGAVPDPAEVGQYTSLGAFYRAIEKGFAKLNKEKKISWDLANVRKQYHRGFWNEFGSGTPIRVYDYKTAKAALELIIEQGEGSTKEHERIQIRPGIEDYTHYEKFRRIEKEIEGIGAGDATSKNEISINDPRVVWPVVDNPRLKKYKSLPNVHALMELFNACYCYTLCLLDELYQNTTKDEREETIPGTERTELFSRRYELERNGIAAMQGILYPIAQALVTTPVDMKHTAGPSFEFYRFGERGAETKKDELVRLCETAIGYHPKLGGDDGVRRQISLLTEI